jgi:hypothetical protein
MKQTIVGYAYKASFITDWLALSVVFTHLAIALGHTIFMLVRQRSLGCWDSLPELLTLAQQSTPSPVALKNITAGICRTKTFRHIVRIRVSEADAEHVELAFDADNNGRDNGRKPDLGLKYG